MNNFKKIGLSALAGSLVAFSVNAAEMTVTGGASLTISDQGNDTEGNTWTMGDGLTFAASGELDNGLTISSKYVIDQSTMDVWNMSIASDAVGTLSFHGMDGGSAMSSVDDVMPNAYEEAWHGSTSPLLINGIATTNMFSYTSPTIGGATLTASYVPSAAATSVKSSTAYAIAYAPEMVEGLTVGYATQEDESGSATTTDDTEESTMYVKYVYGPVTVGYQESELDSDTDTEDADSNGFGITYAVSDALTIGYTEHTYETTGNSSLNDQEAVGITASYTMGGMTIAGIINDVDNVAGATAASADIDAYELNLSFAF